MFLMSYRVLVRVAPDQNIKRGVNKMVFVTLITGQHECGDQEHPNRSLTMEEASVFLLVRLSVSSASAALISTVFLRILNRRNQDGVCKFIFN